MSVDVQTVKRIASLAKLKIDEDKAPAAEIEFNKILQWVDLLKEVDTSSVEPLVSVNENFLEMRRDEVTEGNQAEAVLANAPLKEYGYFAVPKVIE